ncbi:MAG: mechanosensitive ion channel family protein [Candidatus Adiutrix sp.]|jgi:small conductance mechanosensitive channel|nr:mechanosensitive ion channel family protein [Candidatus Adiutrix sp.]
MFRALARWLSASLMVCLFLARPAAAQGPSEVPDLRKADLSKIIEMLEDDRERARVLELLRRLAGPEEAAPAGPPASLPGVWEETILDLADSTRLNLKVSGTGLVQSVGLAAEVLQTLFTPLALELWPAYFLPVFAWGLACLSAAWFVSRRWGRPPAVEEGAKFPARLKLFSGQVLAAAGPCLVLIASLGRWPELSATAPGVTADLALSFVFLQTLVRHLFINCSILYIALKAGSALLIPAPASAASLSGLPAPQGLRIYRTWRFLAVYLAILAFFKEVFLDQFVFGRTYTAALAVLILPGLLGLTARLWRFRGLARAAGGDPESPAYLTDLVIRKCWVFLSLGVLWLAAWAALVGTTGFFLGRLLGTLAVFGLAWGAVKAARLLFANLAGSAPAEEGRRLLVNLDALVGLALGPAALGLILAIWGLPLGRLLENSLARDILGRFLVIFLTLGVLVIFLKFSRQAAEWLLAVPALSGNRNWRTVAPLALTVARALGVFVAGVIVLERLGVDVGPILAGAGILGLGVGLGAQSLVKDLINGITILGLDIVAVGDSVTIGGHSGKVEKVGLRGLSLRDANWNLILVPNSSIDVIINRTRGLSHSILEIVMPPDIDPDELLALARAVAGDFSADAEWSSRLAGPVAVVGVTAFGPEGTTIRLKLTAPAGTQLEPEWELKRRLKQRLLRAGHDSRAFARVVVTYAPE